MADNGKQSLVAMLGLSDRDIEQRLRYVSFGEDDFRRIKALAPLLLPKIGEIADAFFEFMRPMPESQGLFKNPSLLATARRLKADHIRSMLEAKFDRSYAEERLKLGMIYASAKLEPNVFLGAYHHMMHTIGVITMRDPPDGAAEAFQRCNSYHKAAFFDLSLIIDVIVYERERLIKAQQQAIRELSAPTLLVKPGLLLLSVVGMIDSERARQLTESLLSAVRENRARAAVIDITGVAVVDTAVASHLVKTVGAARLMGCSTLISGVSAEVARALVTLGTNLGKVRTVGNLRNALEEAEGYLDKRPAHETLLAPDAQTTPL